MREEKIRIEFLRETSLLRFFAVNLFGTAQQSSSHRTESAAGDDGDLDAAVQHFFQEPEFLPPGKDTPGLGRVLAQMANDPNPLPPARKTQSRRRKPSAIQGVGGPKEPQ
ncbi:MAG TPA: hypothetical protein VN792_00735, partial [Candidatus Acidoferrales bacterium]|nr:hypothetical protein [Candidatus Acidoferrales bacterium]